MDYNNNQVDMYDEENLLLKYAQKIRNQQHFEKILQREDITFDYKPFKIEKLSPEKALIIYQNLHHRYNDSKQLASEPHGWHEYQKRLFVWFMVIYAYYLEKENSALETPSDYKEKINFEAVSRIFFGKSTVFLEFQFLNLFKATDKMVWTEKEDSLLTVAVEKCEQGRWTQVSMQIFKMTGKEKFISSKNCRERWQNHLDKSKIKGNWTEEEDQKIIQFVTQNGKKWSKMRDLLQNKRTQHMIKNRYHSLITKNKAHRHEKQVQTAKRLHQKYENSRKFEGSQQQQNEAVCDQVQKDKVCFKFKEQNVSQRSEGQSSPNPKQLERVQFAVKEEAANQNSIKQVNKVNQALSQNVEVKYEECEEQMGIYPFENYNYGQYDQYYDIHNAHYAMLCQQYMFSVVPTNDTYIPEKGSIQQQGNQGEDR